MTSICLRQRVPFTRTLRKTSWTRMRRSDQRIFRNLNGSGYGPNKVLAERAVQKGFGARTLITRPPVIVGPVTAPIDLLTGSIASMTVATYWSRVIRQIRCSFVDVRDLSEFYVHLLEHSTTGHLQHRGPGLGA